MRFTLINFIKHDLWRIHEQSLPRLSALMIKTLKVSVLAIQGFSRDHCPLRASALTLYSLLAIVPVIAMLFGIAKGFGLEKILEQRLIQQVPEQETMVLQLIRFAQNLLEKTQGEVVAGVGIIVLFWVVINVIGNIETSFNHIWKIGKSRTLGRKFSDYLSLMLLAPIVLIAASSITLFLKTQITWLITWMQLPEWGIWLVIRTLRWSPLLLMSGLFAFLFIFMPNEKIHYRAGLIAGMVTGILYQALQWAYLSMQLGASSYNAIYGSFTALPLLVVWLQMVWMMVLLGCEVAFYIQHYETHQRPEPLATLSLSLQKIIALQITQVITKHFLQSAQPLSAAVIATQLGLSGSIIRMILAKLSAAHIIIGCMLQNNEEEVYLPAVDSNNLSIAYVINALEQCGQTQLPEFNAEQVFGQAVKQFRLLIERSEDNRLLKDV